MVEVCFDSKETAIQLRKAFEAKRKTGEGMGKLYLLNVITLAIRVWVDIMIGIASLRHTDGWKNC